MRMMLATPCAHLFGQFVNEQSAGTVWHLAAIAELENRPCHRWASSCYTTFGSERLHGGALACDPSEFLSTSEAAHEHLQHKDQPVSLGSRTARFARVWSTSLPARCPQSLRRSQKVKHWCSCPTAWRLRHWLQAECASWTYRGANPFVRWACFGARTVNRLRSAYFANGCCGTCMMRLWQNE